MTTLKKLPAKIEGKPVRKSAIKKTVPQKEEEAKPEGMLMSFFCEELKYIYCAELHLLQVLPILKVASHSEALKIALGEHLFQTEIHVLRLEEIFQMLEKTPETKKCAGIEGITKEIFETIEGICDTCALRDVAIIMGTQKAEHFEISTYGSLKQLALTLERNDIADILGLTLAEEKSADELLTELATRNTNIEAQVLS